MSVIIMRGLPGAGKSHYVKTLDNPIICSADLSHTTGGVYKFDPMKKESAHDDCLKQFVNLLDQFAYNIGRLIVVDNTNLTAWEIAPYYRLAQVYKQPVEIVRIHCTYEESVKYNQHQVPPEQLWKMYQTLLNEKLPPWWKEKIILRS